MELDDDSHAIGASLPADWTSPELQDIAEEPICYGIVQVGKYDARGTPVLAIKNLNTDYITNVHRTSAKVEQAYVRTRTQAGDVVVSVKGTIGRVGLVPPHFEGNISRDLARIRPRKDVSPEFLSQVLRADLVQIRFAAATVGTTRQELSIAPLKKIRVPLPPTLSEQEVIGGALSDADALIESLGQLLAKKRQIKQGVMQKLLTGKRRLPEFQEDWQPKRLDELAEIRSGGTPSTAQPSFWDGRILWCTPTDITALGGAKYLSATARTISLLGLKSSSAEVIPAHSVVMTSRATIGECAINVVPVTTNQGFKNFVTLSHTNVEFFFYLLLMQKDKFVALCGGSTFLEIGKMQLERFQVSVPPTEREQSEIAKVLSAMDDDIALLRMKLEKARQVKDGIMQNLLTGRIRLVDAKTANDLQLVHSA